jgi:cytochrome c oxidase subunit 4
MHTHATSDSAHSSHDQGDPLKIYIAVFCTLMVLLLLTVGAYYIDFSKRNIGEHNLGWVNTAIALTIAFIKAIIVGLFFMHLRHSTRLTWVVAAAGLVFLCIMILFTFSDFESRSLVAESLRDGQVDVQASTHANSQLLLEEIPNQVQTMPW